MKRVTVAVDGEPFVCETLGPDRGPVAIFLHGFPDLPSSWDRVMQHFAHAGYRCVAPYLRGYSPSTTRGPFGLDRLARDVLGIARELSPKKPVYLLGHDWGAAITWFVAMKAPRRLGAAMAMSTPHPVSFGRNAARDPFQIWRSRYMFRFQVTSTDRAGIEALWRRWSPGLEPPAEHLDRVAATIEASDGAPLEYYRWIPRPTRLEWLRYVDRDRATVRAPLLYLHGIDDGCISPHMAKGQVYFIDAPYRMEVIVGAGHFVQVERPEQVAGRTLRFFETYGPTRPKRIGVTT